MLILLNETLIWAIGRKTWELVPYLDQDNTDACGCPGKHYVHPIKKASFKEILQNKSSIVNIARIFVPFDHQNKMPGSYWCG